MSQGPLELLVKETRAAFIIAKSDGNLDAGEMIQIAVELSQKLQKLGDLSGSEKKSVLLSTLKKGLADSGGVDTLPGLADASAEVKEAFIDNLIEAASVSIDMVLSAASGKLDLRKPSSWAQCIPVCFGMIRTLTPKDKAIVKKSVEAPSQPEVTEVTQVKVVSVD
jgi:hypothetical protein